MNILVVANYEPDRQESMLRFASILAAGLRDASHTVRVVRPAPIAAKLRVARAAAKWLGYVDKFLLFPAALQRAAEWADVVHICDHSNASYVERIQHVPHLVTCHDVLAIRSALGDIASHRTRWSGRRLQAMILKGLRRAGNIACVSEATRHDLANKLGIPDERLSIVYNGLNPVYTPMDVQQARHGVEQLTSKSFQRFFLHVGSNEWYKNRLGALRLFGYLHRRPELRDVRMLMVGPALTSEMKQFVADEGLGAWVTELSGIRDQELRALYSSAEALIFPSLYEGFGWPIIEAQACGCLVATSGRAPMTEVGGEAAVYFDPDNLEKAAATIADALAGCPSRRDGNLQNANRFQTAHMIEGYLRLYDRLRSLPSGSGVSAAAASVQHSR